MTIKFSRWNNWPLKWGQKRDWNSVTKNSCKYLQTEGPLEEPTFHIGKEMKVQTWCHLGKNSTPNFSLLPLNLQGELSKDTKIKLSCLVNTVITNCIYHGCHWTSHALSTHLFNSHRDQMEIARFCSCARGEWWLQGNACACLFELS